MNTEERTRILNLVAAGQISPAEAGDLLAALDTQPRPAPPPPLMPLPPAPVPTISQMRPVIARNLVIRIVDEGDAKVNVRIPLSLARAAGRFLPRQAKAALKEYEIDLDHILEEISGDTGSGALVEVQDDDTHVFIGVE
jgi:hypothetical protein